MPTTRLPDKTWAKLLNFLRAEPGVYVGEPEACRRYIEAVLWVTRSGAQWRLLPARYGAWNSVYRRFARWCERGIWERLHAHFADDPDMEHLLLDATIVRAHPCAAGASKKRRPGGARRGPESRRL